MIDGFIADFFCDSADLIVEVDGAVHAEQKDYDQCRDSILQARGLSIFRIPNQQITNDLPSVLECIAAACRNRLR